MEKWNGLRGSGFRGNVLVVMGLEQRGDEVGGGAWKRNKPSPEREGVERKHEGKGKSPFLMPVETWNGKGDI
jgi:hypothetical protein